MSFTLPAVSAKFVPLLVVAYEAAVALATMPMVHAKAPDLDLKIFVSIFLFGSIQDTLNTLKSLSDTRVPESVRGLEGQILQIGV